MGIKLGGEGHSAMQNEKAKKEEEALDLYYDEFWHF